MICRMTDFLIRSSPSPTGYHGVHLWRSPWDAFFNSLRTTGSIHPREHWSIPIQHRHNCPSVLPAVAMRHSIHLFADRLFTPNVHPGRLRRQSRSESISSPCAATNASDSDAPFQYTPPPTAKLKKALLSVLAPAGGRPLLGECSRASWRQPPTCDLSNLRNCRSAAVAKIAGVLGRDTHHCLV